MNLLPTLAFSALILSTIAWAQAKPSNSVVSSPAIVVVPDEAVARTENGPEIAVDPASLLPDLPALPPAKATLIGGTIEKLDRVQDQLTLQAFGGGKFKILFDTRTHIYRDGALVSAADLRQGDRIYADTILDGSNVFARNIRLKSSTPMGESQGVILSYRRDRGELKIRDLLSPKGLDLQITPSTRIVRGDRAASANDLAPGTLIAVKFHAQRDGRDLAHEVSVLAVPGSIFTFTGQVTTVDLRTGLLVLTSRTNRKTYEIYLDPSLVSVGDDVRNGADVTVVTRFDGNRYVARNVTIDKRAD